MLNIETYENFLTASNSKDIVPNYDVIIDASDNPATRYLVNDLAVYYKKPLVHGSSLRWEGQLTIYNYEDGPCYRCVFAVPPPAHMTSS